MNKKQVPNFLTFGIFGPPQTSYQRLLQHPRHKALPTSAERQRQPVLQSFPNHRFKGKYMSEANKFSKINRKDWFEKDSEREPLLPQKLVFLKEEVKNTETRLIKHQPTMLIRSTEAQESSLQLCGRFCTAPSCVNSYNEASVSPEFHLKLGIIESEY